MSGTVQKRHGPASESAVQADVVCACANLCASACACIHEHSLFKDYIVCEEPSGLRYAASVTEPELLQFRQRMNSADSLSQLHTVSK